MKKANVNNNLIPHDQLISLMKKIANAIRAEINKLKKRCDELEKIAVELDNENIGSKQLSERTMRRIENQIQKQSK